MLGLGTGALGAPLAAEAGAGEDAAWETAQVARAKRDRGEFAPLYARYAERVYWFCFGRLGEREAAEDAAALVFAKALAALPTCRDDRFRPWLFGIARNVVADVGRERARRAEGPLEEARAVADRAPGPEAAALAEEGHRAVAALLARLPEGQRRVVELRLAGLTGREVARTLGRTHVWVRVTQYRAYARLRDLLAADPTAYPDRVPARAIRPEEAPDARP